MRERLNLYLCWAVVLVSLYTLVSISAYSLAHPDMTEMRKFLNIWDALKWDWDTDTPQPGAPR